jgi:SAM-dependent methyltransferase
MMLPKPNHLGPHYASHFKDQSIIDAYHHRPPYSKEVFERLSELITDRQRTVLDVGCGIGDIARGLVDLTDRVDAVDFSQGMIEKGKRLPGGDHPNINWICGRVEEVPLAPPYALITAGDSLHWMAWDVVIPRFQGMLTPRGYLAIISRSWGDPVKVKDRLTDIFARYSVVWDYKPYDLIQELTIRGLFRKHGEKRTNPTPWRPSVEEYIESRHAQCGFSRDRMGKERAAAFDAEVREAMSEFSKDGKLELETDAKVIWGKPNFLSDN